MQHVQYWNRKADGKREGVHSRISLARPNPHDPARPARPRVMPNSQPMVTLVVELLAVLLVVIAIGVPQWSVSKVFRVFVLSNSTNRGQEGTVEVGLWQVGWMWTPK